MGAVFALGIIEVAGVRDNEFAAFSYEIISQLGAIRRRGIGIPPLDYPTIGGNPGRPHAL